MEAEDKIKEGLSFDEMQSWLLSRDEIYRDAIGEDVFDGFAFTYQGGYILSSTDENMYGHNVNVTDQEISHESGHGEKNTGKNAM